jgi:hypothetical protein
MAKKNSYEGKTAGIILLVLGIVLAFGWLSIDIILGIALMVMGILSLLK